MNYSQYFRSIVKNQDAILGRYRVCLRRIIELSFSLLVVLVFSFTSKAEEKNHATFSCTKCHQTEKPTPSLAGLKKSYTSFCSECHKSHKLNHTQYPGLGKWTKQEFPLDDNKISCITCHEEAKCRDKKNLGRLSLRGGPYAKPEEFCSRCHEAEPKATAVKNPHCLENKQLEERCFQCHEYVKNIEVISQKNPHLKTTGEQLCLNCHKANVHPLALSHQGLQLAERLPQEKYQNLIKSGLWLDKKTGMSCLSCHLPHHQEKCKATKNNLLRQSEKHTNQLCLKCHDFK